MIGTYSAFSASACLACPANFICPDPTQPPQPCPAGKYPTNGAKECSDSPDGLRVNADGSTTDCVPGELCTNKLNPKSHPMPAGKSAIMPSGPATSCAAGSYSNEGDKRCTVCPVGSFCPAVDHPPIACPAGTYQILAGQTTCNLCPKGFSCATSSVLPIRCPLGTFAAFEGAKACTNCPAGNKCLDPTIAPQPCTNSEYAPTTSTMCFPCPAGFECATDRGVPTACGTGFYSLAKDGICKKCPVGYYCSTKANNPMPCQVGYTTNGLSGQTYCTACPANKDCSQAGIASTCPSGTFALAGSSKCQDCPFGHWCDPSGVNGPTKCTEGQVVNQARTACIDCPKGYECPSGEFSRMRMCDPGYYAVDSGNTKSPGYCTVCPAGQFCATQDKLPVNCPDGWFADIGQTYCTRCPPGQNCLDKTGRHNVDCPHGTYYDWLDQYGSCAIYDATCAAVTKPFCVKCPAGKFCPVANGGDRTLITGKSNTVQECVDGTWSKDYATTCILAEPGWFPQPTKTGQATCSSNEYSYGGNVICETCPKGHECTFMKTAVPCPIFFTSALGDQDCSPCPDGKDCRHLKIAKSLGGSQSTEVPGMSDWQDPISCAAGFYTKSHNFYCVPCPIGHQCPLGAKEPTICPPGKYAGQQQASCTTCPTEYWSNEGEEYCTPIPPGMKSISNKPGFEICPHTKYSMWGEATCNTCPDGFLCTKKHNYPTDWAYSCPRGSYCIAGVQTKCPKGYFGTMERAKTLADGCEKCPAGYDCQPGTEHFMQVPCPLGSYCPDEQAYAHPCPAGTYGEQLFSRSLADCITCDTGTQCSQGNPGRGATCEQGYYCPRGSAVRQFPCPAGTYGAYKTGKRDLSECLPCPPGHYCAEATATPTPAPIGYYSSLSGMPSLQALMLCPPKFYCPITGMTSYKSYPCPIGHYCPLGTSLINQYPCPEGTFSDRQEIHDPLQCLICPKGFYCAAGSTSAKLQNLTGGKMDGECTMHHYCPDGTKSSAIPKCPAGTYAPYYRSLSVEDCLPCPPGKFCNEGAGPADCPMGYYCPEGTENQYKYPCPAGYYNDQTQQFSIYACKPCGIGNGCPVPGMTTLASVKCADGFYNNESTVATSCTPCPAGYYCKDLMTGTAPQSPHPIPCPAGKYSTIGSISCSYCVVGTYCPLEGTSETQMKLNLCPSGTYCQRTVTMASYGLDVYPNKDDHGCPMYFYCPMGTIAPLPIPPGTMIKVTGAGSLSEAIQLPAGWFAKEFSDATVEGATFATGYASATVCNPGRYCPPGSYQQIECPAGTFRANYYGRSVTDCGKCPAGTYCPSTGISLPTDCPKGFFCPEGSIQPTYCPRGTYNPNKNKYDSRDCTKCDPGFYCPFLGQEDIDIVNHQCDKGFLCLGGSSRPEPTDGVSGQECPQGYYCIQAQGAAGTLDPTTKNTFAAGQGPFKDGLGKPQSCEAGQQGLYKRAFHIEDCIACLPGYYCPGSGGTSPAIPCTEGYFCPSPYGANVNYGVAATPSTIPALIAQKGYYAPLGYYMQIPCNIGTYTDVLGQPSCKGCPAGTFCNVVQTSDPVLQRPCPAGYYCISYDETQQLCANPGKVDESQCYLEQVLLKCPPGTYAGPYVAGNAPTSKIKLSECVACPSGYACPEEAMSLDTANLPKCAAGYFCKASATTRYPLTLAPGKYGPCPAGYFCPEGTGDYTLNPCPLGTYSSQERAIDINYCIPCPPGYKCEGTGLTAPTEPCDAGTFCSYTGTFPTYSSITIQQCTASHYCPQGSYNQLVCPAGFFQTNLSRGQCQPCPAGAYCLKGNLANCPKGYYCE